MPAHSAKRPEKASFRLRAELFIEAPQAWYFLMPRGVSPLIIPFGLLASTEEKRKK